MGEAESPNEPKGARPSRHVGQMLQVIRKKEATKKEEQRQIQKKPSNEQSSKQEVEEQAITQEVKESPIKGKERPKGAKGTEIQPKEPRAERRRKPIKNQGEGVTVVTEDQDEKPPLKSTILPKESRIVRRDEKPPLRTAISVALLSPFFRLIRRFVRDTLAGGWKAIFEEFRKKEKITKLDEATML